MNNLNLDDFPDSAHANELRAGLGGLRFAPLLEGEFTVSHLRRVELRVRIWFGVAAVATLFFAAGQLHRAGIHDLFSQIYLMALLPCAVLLAGIVWSPWYRRWYLPASQILVPLFSMLSSILITEALREGREEELAALTVNLMAAYFFAGLKFRQALFTCVAIIVVFCSTALLIGLEPALFIKSAVAIAIIGVTTTIVYWDVEQAYRRSFLESALINQLVALDPLTGLLNRRAFDTNLLRIWHQAQRNQQTVAVLMIDVDYFKRYNDEHGHQVGDLALKSVAEVIQSFARRPLDFAARYGGEEFALILYDLTLDYLETVAEQVRGAVQELHAQRPELPSEITISIGVGLTTPTQGRSARGALQLADDALYEAKCAGRNRVVVKGIDAYMALVTGAFKTVELRRH